MIQIMVFDVALLVQIAAMLVLMFILNSMLFKPIRQMLEERAAKMSSLQGDVEKYEHNASQLLTSFNEKLAEARRAGQGERERLKTEARTVEKGLIAASSKEADGIKQSMLSDLGTQVEAVRKDLRAKSEGFAAEIAQKLLGRAI